MTEAALRGWIRTDLKKKIMWRLCIGAHLESRQDQSATFQISIWTKIKILIIFFMKIISQTSCDGYCIRYECNSSLSQEIFYNELKHKVNNKKQQFSFCRKSKQCLRNISNLCVKESWIIFKNYKIKK